ncbi:MAG: type II toxin-antitoxin system PemK/MazF family toxin [Clostridia bacterium]|nr:type II toxin-antitoxin system PemK/MazF family toxin [Clostridia bacterium]MBQ2248929.1 type II toxin-antitoxin system PemK/MazF family toxin [Clostridia bacterium]
MSVRRGDIYYADLSPVVGSEQGGLRPVLIIQNDVGNKYSPTVIAAAITSRMSKARLPTHIDVYADRVGLQKDSVILLEQIRTLDKRRLKEKMGHLDEEMMDHVNTAIAISFGLGDAKQDAEARARMQSLPSYTPARVPTAGMPNVAAGMPSVAAGMPNVAVASTQNAPTGVANTQNAATGVANPPTAAAVGTSLPSASASAEPQAKSPERE